MVPQRGGEVHPRLYENTSGFWKQTPHTKWWPKSHSFHVLSCTSHIRLTQQTWSGRYPTFLLNNHKTQKTRFRSTGENLRGWSCPLPSYHGQAYSHALGVLPVPDGCRSKFSWFLGSVPRFHWRVQTKCPVVPWLGCVPRSWTTARQPRSQKCQLWYPLSQPMLQRGKQSHQDHFAGSKNFITLADSGEINSQSPEPWSVSGDIP
jgi:hypothetical protein